MKFRHTLLRHAGLALGATAAAVLVSACGDPSLGGGNPERQPLGKGDEAAAESLRFGGLQASCPAAEVEYSHQLFSVSAMFAQAEIAARGCVLVGYVVVPAGVKLQRMEHRLLGSAKQPGQLHYRVTLNGRELANTNKRVAGEVDESHTSDVAHIGQMLCNTGRETRVPFRIEASIRGQEAYLDSIDWNFVGAGFC